MLSFSYVLLANLPSLTYPKSHFLPNVGDYFIAN